MLRSAGQSGSETVGPTTQRGVPGLLLVSVQGLSYLEEEFAEVFPVVLRAAVFFVSRIKPVDVDSWVCGGHKQDERERDDDEFNTREGERERERERREGGESDVARAWRGSSNRPQANNTPPPPHVYIPK